MSESLRSYMEKAGCVLDKKHLQSAAVQLLATLRHKQHEIGFITPNNIQVEQESFKLSLQKADNELNVEQLINDNAWVQYQSPDVLSGKHKVQVEADALWSVGCMLWEMASGSTPFKVDSTKLTAANIQQRRIVNQLPNKADKDVKSFLEMLMAGQTALEAIMKVPFITEASKKKIAEKERQEHLKREAEAALETAMKLYPAQRTSVRQETMLMECAEKGDVDGVLKNIAQAGATNLERLSALMYAALSGSRDCVKALLSEAGIEDNEKWTALMSAALNGKTDCVDLLAYVPAERAHFSELMLGAMLGDFVEVKVNLGQAKQTCGNGWTALMLAAACGRTECVKLLLDETGKETEYGWTALQLAADNGYPECIKLLLAESGQLNCIYETALVCALRKNCSFASQHKYLLLEAAQKDCCALNHVQFDKRCDILFMRRLLQFYS